MDPRDLQRASFRGVPFLVSSTGFTGGRRLVRKRFPNSDRQALEDLGLNPREFVISGVVAAQRDPSGAEIKDYREIRNALIAALETRGTGVLIHPFLGRFEKVAVVGFNLSESMTSLGDAPIEMTFSINSADSLPKATESVVGSISAGSVSVLAATVASVASGFVVTESFFGNFTDAVEKITAVGDGVRDAVEVTATDVDSLDAFVLKIESYQGSVLTSIGNPQVLGQDTIDLVSSIKDLYPNQVDTFFSLTRLFDFGDNDTTIVKNTVGRTERRKNRNVMNSAVQSPALSEAYLAAANITFDTTDDIDSAAVILEDQWQKLLAAGIMDEDEEESLTKLRVSTNLFFDQERDLRPRVVTIRTNLTSASLLAYQYYGESSQGDTIAKLNGFQDGAGIEGNVKVLSA